MNSYIHIQEFVESRGLGFRKFTEDWWSITDRDGMILANFGEENLADSVRWWCRGFDEGRKQVLHRLEKLTEEL